MAIHLRDPAKAGRVTMCGKVSTKEKRIRMTTSLTGYTCMDCTIILSETLREQEELQAMANIPCDCEDQSTVDSHRPDCKQIAALKEWAKARGITD